MGFIEIVIYISVYIGLIAISFYILSYVSSKKKEQKFYTNKELPKVSVIIPAYNEEAVIEKTIKSVIKSNYPKDLFEVLVVDDGSKDKTFERAKKFESEIVKVFSKKNGGKASALNFAIKRAKGEIIFTMDADTFVKPRSLKNMVVYFKDEEIMSVTPSIVTYKPKSIWQRIQHMEYLFGLFLRKTFASLNAIYITPGAFSAYRKKFFEKHGGFDEGNITEDLEMSLRIQYCGYRIENSITSPAFTLAPKSFANLLEQRKRWYTGLMKNLWKHKKIISKGYGDLGLFVIPIAVISVFFAIFITTYMVIKTLFKIAGEIVFWNTVNFNLPNLLNLNLHILERFFFLFFTNPIILFILLFGILMRIYLVFARKSVGKTPGLAINLPLFFIFFAILFGFWWVVSLIYFLFNKEVKWK